MRFPPWPNLWVGDVDHFLYSLIEILETLHADIYIYLKKKKKLWLWTSFKFTKEWLKKAVLLLFWFELSHQCVSSSCYDLLTYCNVKLASFTASSSCDILTFMNVMKIVLPPWPKFSVIMALNKKREKKDIVHHFNAAVSV